MTGFVFKSCAHAALSNEDVHSGIIGFKLIFCSSSYLKMMTLERGTLFPSFFNAQAFDIIRCRHQQ